jgi:N-methylhydantoinase A
VNAQTIEHGDGNPRRAAKGDQKVFIDNAEQNAIIYDRAGLLAGDRIAGPAVVIEMDSTTLVLPQHAGAVDRYGNILIQPVKAH